MADDSPGLVGKATTRASGQGVHTVKTLGEAGLIKPQRPDRTVRALLAMQRWGFTPAAGYAANAARYPNDDAIIDELGRLTFAEVHERTNRLATAWMDDGLGEGDSVAIMCRNHRGFIETTVAASKLGMTCLYLNTAFAGPQLTEVVAAREARRDRLRRGVLRAARGRRQAPQALRRLARLGARRPARRDARGR